MSVISVTSLEVGDLVLWTASGAVRLGVVLRPLTTAEVVARVPSGGSGAWVELTTGGFEIILDWDAALVGEPPRDVIQAVLKSHKTASDDLGPALGLPNPN